MLKARGGVLLLPDVAAHFEIPGKTRERMHRVLLLPSRCEKSAVAPLLLPGVTARFRYREKPGFGCIRALLLPALMLTRTAVPLLLPGNRRFLFSDMKKAPEPGAAQTIEHVPAGTFRWIRRGRRPWPRGTGRPPSSSPPCQTRPRPCHPRSRPRRHSRTSGGTPARPR